jgi:hypothetical protein
MEICYYVWRLLSREKLRMNNKHNNIHCDIFARLWETKMDQTIICQQLLSNDCKQWPLLCNRRSAQQRNGCLYYVPVISTFYNMRNGIFYAVHAEFLSARASCSLVQSRIDSWQLSEFGVASAMELVIRSIVAVAEARKQFGNPDEGESPPLEDRKPLPSNGNEWMKTLLWTLGCVWWLPGIVVTNCVQKNTKNSVYSITIRRYYWIICIIFT